MNPRYVPTQQHNPHRTGNAYDQTQAYTKPHEFHGPLSENASEPVLLNDDEMKSFLLNGFLTVKPSTLSPSFHNYIIEKMNKVESSDQSGNNCLPLLPALNQVYSDPTVRGALMSILGTGYGMHPHRAVHFSPPGKKSQGWHRDTFWGYKLPLRNPRPWMVMGMYYPQQTTLEMGPTAAKPGTQYYTIDPKRYTGKLPIHFKTDDRTDMMFTCEAGSVTIIHYDLIHKGTANLSNFGRYMFKFQFYRVEIPTSPSWQSSCGPWTTLPATVSPRKKSLEPICVCIWEWLRGHINPKRSEMEDISLCENELKGLLNSLDSPTEWTRFEVAFKLSLAGKNDVLINRLFHQEEQMRSCAAYALATSPRWTFKNSKKIQEILSGEGTPLETKMTCAYILSEWPGQGNGVVKTLVDLSFLDQ
eukprot:TRINITY_DN3599_c0_g1_i24.p1 TRINITY_DN3599_c0_g1~~TRINITY_DN3599_c0_g1_i24.p1  ORF type:complete len:416 (-),score=59.85 TRINITY_DN3599_c0_g1_i24:1056-2303(-)